MGQQSTVEEPPTNISFPDINQAVEASGGVPSGPAAAVDAAAAPAPAPAPELSSDSVGGDSGGDEPAAAAFPGGSAGARAAV